MNQLATQDNKGIKAFFERPEIKSKITELVGQNNAVFTTSLLQVVNSNGMLKNATPMSIFSAACMAATLNLPINNNLGHAYIVPFKNTKANTTEAQFQLGYKGFIQLALRTNQFKTLNSSPVLDGQLVGDDPLRGYKFDWSKKGGQVIGYAAYFLLLNGFEACFFMSKEEVEAHAKKYSQSFRKGEGVWADNFEAMALKTVMKLLLSKQAPLSIEMQKAIMADQAVIKDADGQNIDYIDHETGEVVTGEVVSEEKNALQPCPPEKISNYKKAIAAGKDAEDVLAMASTKYLLTKEQCEDIRSAGSN